MGQSLRSAGWSAIASGLVGFVAFGILQVAVFNMIKMLSSPSQAKLLGFVSAMFSAHLVGITLQYLLMIPVAIGLHALTRRQFPDLSRVAVTLGVVSLSLTMLCALLHFVGVVADSFYMIPQGVVGVWIMIVSRQLSSPGSRALARFGMVVGCGLLLVGTFPLAMASSLTQLFCVALSHTIIRTKNRSQTRLSITSFSLGLCWACSLFRSGPSFLVADCCVRRTLDQALWRQRPSCPHE